MYPVRGKEDNLIHTSCLLGTTHCSMNCRTLVVKDGDRPGLPLDRLKNIDPHKLIGIGKPPFQKIPGLVHKGCVLMSSRGGRSGPCMNCEDDIKELIKNLNLIDNLIKGAVIVSAAALLIIGMHSLFSNRTS